MIDVFISRSNWIPKGVAPHIPEFYALLDQNGFRPQTVGTNVVPMNSPFEEVRTLMKRCRCTIVLGIHQITSDQATIKGKACGALVLPTEWNQIEATMSLMLELPTLVLIHKNVATRGIFERGAANLFVHQFSAQRKGWASSIAPALLGLKAKISP